MHWFIDFNSIFYGIFGCFNEAHFRLILFFIAIFIGELIELLDGKALVFYTFFPYFHFISL